ncbi:MAG: metal-dependent transcriptional regulator [Promethearchaeota archaeon]
MAKKNNLEGVEISEIPESYQRYLDVIYEISKNKRGGWVSNKEIAENLNIEPASVSGMLEKLRKSGLIKWEPRRAIRLTEKGKIYAKQLNEIHDLLRIFFGTVLKIEDKEVLEEITCQIEHHITFEVKKSLQKFLSNYQD